MSTLTLENVSRTAVSPRIKGLNMDVSDGEFCIICGGDGSAGSLIVRMICGLERVDSGKIHFRGTDVTTQPPQGRGLAYISGRDRMVPGLTLRENIALGGGCRKESLSDMGRRVESAAEMTGIEAHLDHFPDTVGRVTLLMAKLARGIFHQAKMFVMDDPLSGLLRSEREAMWMKLQTFSQQIPSSMVLSTSEPLDALALGTRVVVLSADSEATVILQDDAPGRIYRSPAHQDVAKLAFGHPVAFIAGTLKADGAGTIFREAGGGTLEIRIPPRDSLNRWTGREVVAGVRGEDCQIISECSGGKPSGGQVVAEAIVPQGYESYVHVDSGGHRLRAIFRGEGLPPGRRLNVLIPGEFLLFFDPATGQSIR